MTFSSGFTKSPSSTGNHCQFNDPDYNKNRRKSPFFTVISAVSENLLKDISIKLKMAMSRKVSKDITFLEATLAEATSVRFASACPFLDPVSRVAKNPKTLVIPFDF